MQGQKLSSWQGNVLWKSQGSRFMHLLSGYAKCFLMRVWGLDLSKSRNCNYIFTSLNYRTCSIRNIYIHLKNPRPKFHCTLHNKTLTISRKQPFISCISCAPRFFPPLFLNKSSHSTYVHQKKPQFCYPLVFKATFIMRLLAVWFLSSLGKLSGAKALYIEMRRVGFCTDFGKNKCWTIHNGIGCGIGPFYVMEYSLIIEDFGSCFVVIVKLWLN